MDTEVDHYIILDLPSGEEGAKLTDIEISKGFRLKALELHPDKRPDDPNANENFQQLNTSYEVLRDDKLRKSFDDLLKIKREKALRRSRKDSKRRKMMVDLEERERSGFSPDVSGRHQNQEEITARELKDGIARIHAMQANIMKGKKESISGLDREKLAENVGPWYPVFEESEESVIEKLRRAAQKDVFLGKQSEESMAFC